MKYKHIHSCIHNFGHSFTSLTNYVDDGYIIDELVSIHANGYDIEVDWLKRSFEPEQMATPRIKKSIGYWADTLQSHMASQNVDLQRLTTLAFRWPQGKRKYMIATDDRGKDYKIYVNEVK